MLAEWLDNDEDGCVDNPTVLTKLLEKVDNAQASIVVTVNGTFVLNASR